MYLKYIFIFINSFYLYKKNFRTIDSLYLIKKKKFIFHNLSKENIYKLGKRL